MIIFSQIVSRDPVDPQSPRKVIMRTDKPIDSVVLYPKSPLVKSLQKLRYIYYTSGGVINRVNQDDPSDKTTISRSGGSSYNIDSPTNKLYYVSFNRIIKQEDLESGETKDLVSST